MSDDRYGINYLKLHRNYLYLAENVLAILGGILCFPRKWILFIFLSKLNWGGRVKKRENQGEGLSSYLVLKF